MSHVKSKQFAFAYYAYYTDLGLPTNYRRGESVSLSFLLYLCPPNSEDRLHLSKTCK